MYYDITQEVFSGGVYPGDASPSFVRAESMERGDECNLTDFAMCAHNGTHVDAPAHYIAGGKTVESLELSRFAGKCVVCSAESAAAALGAGARRLLLKGKEEITPAFAARLRGKLLLLGMEGNRSDRRRRTAFCSKTRSLFWRGSTFPPCRKGSTSCMPSR